MCQLIQTCSVSKYPGSTGQRVVLTGYDQIPFQDSLKAITNINATFEVEVPDDQFEPFETLEVDGLTCLKFTNRYLTPKDSAGGHQILSLDDVDPRGYLKRAAGPRYVHTEENVVQYFRQRMFQDDKGNV